jgi:hypothetical protein
MEGTITTKEYIAPSTPTLPPTSKPRIPSIIPSPMEIKKLNSTKYQNSERRALPEKSE